MRYQVVLSEPLGVNEVPVSFVGIPTIGSKHPNRPLYVTDYQISQPDGAAKSTLDVVVNYAPKSETTTPGEQGQPDVIQSVIEWGWDDSTGEKELVATVDTPPVPVLNSAGDPFDSVPTVSVPTPVFTKVLRNSQRITGYSQYNCTVNDRQITIGDMTCAAKTLLCTVAEKKVIGEWRLPYEYTVKLKYRSTVVPDSNGIAQEIGWNAAITDAGMREIDEQNGGLKLIEVWSRETGKPATVTSPELLDGQGHAISRSASGATPVVLTFSAYKQMQFPDWMYSEPPTPPEPTDGE